MKPTRQLLALALIGATAATQAGTLAHADQRARSDIVFSDTFEDLSVGRGHDWGWQTAAYAQCVSNSNDAKLDHLTTSALSTDNGYLTITATRRPDGLWNTGLITTGDSCDSGGNLAEVRTGDTILAHVRLPDTGSGAWPALWTWREGGNELDIFEWHSDRTDSLEFANHTGHSNVLYTAPEIGPGQWVYVGAELGADNVTWLVGTDPDNLTAAYEDHVGVGPDFVSYPVLSLSINNGNFHAAPATDEPVTLAIDSLSIIRPR
ncbi:beta-glucanase [Kitasatospora sp. NBC_00240]|uniref:beta-glucanase n=1 Tax=Kitasatospora sp. NBC_00240 TaxID=2903567 RepID=UPI00225BCA7C|nr:beta-glucanase [Kitasatospora sp. NBC_00240]MCX5213272.1 beta-glucanase [Kitasatospora sp. NBC_00240]